VLVLAAPAQIGHGVELVQRARSIYQQIGNAAEAASTGIILARAYLLQSRAADAVPLLEESVATLASAGQMPADLLVARFTLADALWRAGGARGRARALVQQVRVDAVAGGAGFQQLIPYCDDWLRTHH
jgi:hypothetical protein